MKKILHIYLALLVFLLAACETEDFNGGIRSNKKGFTISYSISNPVSAITRSSIPLEEGEDNINSLYILFFENTSGGTGLFLEAINVKADTEKSLGSSGNLDIVFPEGSNLNYSSEYKMLFCANLEEYNSNLQNLEDINEKFVGHSENEVIGTLVTITGVTPNPYDPIIEQLDNSHAMSIYDLPMSASIVKGANQDNISVELSRAVSRFDVFCQASGYELVSASIWNAMTEATLWESIFNDYSADRTQRYYGVAAKEGQIVGSLYAFENYVKEPKQNDEVTTCLIIGLRNTSTGNIEYFRANINAANMGQQLKRNNMYRTTVRSVNSEGSDNERGAYQEGTLLIELDINGWTLDGSGNIHYNGENILALPASKINISPLGEESVYNIFTLGENHTLEMQTENIPANVEVELIKNALHIKAPAATAEWKGMLYFTFAGMTGSMIIEQKLYERDFLDLSVYELPMFTTAAGQTSTAIQVNSSAPWVAEIYNGNYFSFTSSGLQPSTQGNTGETFQLHTLTANTATNTRYCFALVYLRDMPDVSRVLVLAQAGTATQYLNVTPEIFGQIPAGGGYTDNITVSASGAWTASLSINTSYTEAVFVDPHTEDGEEEANENTNEVDEPTYSSWSNTKGNSFAIKVSNQTVANIPAEITLTVKLTGTDIEKSYVIRQAPLSLKSIIIHVRRSDRAGSLFNLKKAVTYKYAYDLATNMRNSNLFGPQGAVQMEEEFIFISPTKAAQKLPSSLASIYQLTGVLTQKTFDSEVNNWMNSGSNRILFMCNHDAYAKTNMGYYMNTFNVKGYTVVSSGAKADLNRVFYPEADLTHPLIKYLLEEGPFTKDGAIDPANIALKGLSSTNRALSAWPSTFIPIIMAGNNNKQCVFGIDPTNRMVWVSDPGIFGSRPSTSYQNVNNFNIDKNPDNVKFLNNFIAWLANAAEEGSDFLEKFKQESK